MADEPKTMSLSEAQELEASSSTASADASPNSAALRDLIAKEHGDDTAGFLLSLHARTKRIERQIFGPE